MLDIQELDDMICEQLDPLDLVQCARVNKKWRTLVMPRLWRDLSWINRDDKLGLRGSKRHAFADLVQGEFLEERRAVGCGPDSDHMKAEIDLIVPRVRNLTISIGDTPSPSSVPELMDLLDRRPFPMDRLELSVISSRNLVGTTNEPMKAEPKTCASFRELVLKNYEYTMEAEGFWSALLRRCGRVERLHIVICYGPVPRLVQGMLDYMPHLNDIGFGSGTSTVPITDDEFISFLSGSRHGWKAVRLRLLFGRPILEALSNHFSTLEILNIRECDHTMSRQLCHVLSSCAKLHTLAYSFLDPDRSSYCSEIDFKTFIDLDPETGSAKPWQCEGSLKELKAIITGIPRPDLEENDINESYISEGRGIQSRIYDRLARLTNLEILWLGEGVGAKAQCLEMSLESGLDKLAPLKKLKELNVACLDTRIGVKEVQWMIENWPRLRFIYGLGDHEDHGEALSWLQENYPVEEDYLAKQRYQDSQRQGYALEQPTCTLSKYGHRIRLLPNPSGFPKPRELLQHLFKRCPPEVQVGFFDVRIQDMDLESGDIEKAIIDFTLPRVRYLFVDVDRTSPLSSIAKLMDFLGQRSIVLETIELRLRAKISNSRMRRAEGEHMRGIPKSCTSLKELILDIQTDNTDADAFLPSLLRRCGGVEKLRVDRCLGSAQRLAQGMMAYMPNLCEINLDHCSCPYRRMSDDTINTPLRMIQCMEGREVGARVRESYHRRLVEALFYASKGCGGSLSKHLVQMLFLRQSTGHIMVTE
ncbi:MAG: hypothetical protein J3Q66DRAFT_443373 [Benniella sp.]|nr:MAG: hypothetical protein J3Q66DRAFT_443373 [Benniella sp.]